MKSVNFALKPNFWMMRAYFRDASLESSSDLAPVTTILPLAKMRAVVCHRVERLVNNIFDVKVRTLRPYFRLTNSHDDGSKSLRIVFCVSCMERDRLEVESAIEIYSGHDVLRMSALEPYN